MTRNPDDYIEVPPDALVRTSGQLWKLIVGTIAIPLPTLFLGLGFLRRIGPDQPRSEVVGRPNTEAGSLSTARGSQEGW